MTSVNRAGIFSRIAAYGALAAAGIAGAVDINNSNIQEKDTITAGQRLDERFLNDRRFNSQRVEIREHQVAVAELTRQFQEEKATNQQAVDQSISAQVELNRRLGLAEEENARLQSNLSLANGANTSLRQEFEAAKIRINGAETQIAQTREGINQTASQLSTQVTSVSSRINAIESRKVELIKKVSPSVVMITTFDSEKPTERKDLFSGFVVKIKDKKYLISCGHGHAGEESFLKQKMTLTSFDGKNTYTITPGEITSGIKSYSSANDGDFLCIELPEDFNFPSANGLTLADSVQELLPGQEVFVLGSPLGFRGSVASGIISRPQVVGETGGGRVIHRIEFGFGLNPGYSGCPVLNEYGEVVGMGVMTTRSLTSIGIANRTSHLKRELLGAGLDVMSEKELALAKSLKSEEIALLERRKKETSGIVVGIFRFFARPDPDLKGPKLEVPPLPEPVVPITPGPPAEPLTPEPGSEFSKPYDTAPAPKLAEPEEAPRKLKPVLPTPVIPDEPPLKEAPPPPQ
jgi:hypothetical protein